MADHAPLPYRFILLHYVAHSSIYVPCLLWRITNLAVWTARAILLRRRARRMQQLGSEHIEVISYYIRGSLLHNVRGELHIHNLQTSKTNKAQATAEAHQHISTSDYRDSG